MDERPLDGRSIQVCTSLPDDAVREIDAICELEQISRSEALRRMIDFSQVMLNRYREAKSITLADILLDARQARITGILGKPEAQVPTREEFEAIRAEIEAGQ